MSSYVVKPAEYNFVQYDGTNAEAVASTLTNAITINDGTNDWLISSSTGAVYTRSRKLESGYWYALGLQFTEAEAARLGVDPTEFFVAVADDSGVPHGCEAV